MALSAASRLPPELLDQIFLSLYNDLQPRASLDAVLQLSPASGPVPMTGAPVFASSLRNQAIRNFYRFCFVCKAWATTAQPYLFRHIRVEVPRQWESLLEVIAEPEESEELEEIEAERAGRSTAVHGLQRGILRSPPQSRQGSRSRSRSRARSPNCGDHRAHSLDARLRSVALSRSVSESGPEQASDRLPGLHIESLTFSSFNTVGMRRTIGQGSRERFVTQDKVLRLLQGTRSVGLLTAHGELQDPYLEPDEDPNDERGRLKAVGLTEYMDSALQREVLDELLLRGGVEIDTKEGPMLTGSPAALAACPLVALDLCGCISPRFAEGMAAFVKANRLGLRSHRFPHLKRLGLFSVHIDSTSLEAFVLAFPSLTHLDLTNTRATDVLLAQMSTSSPRMQLQSLSLARCKMLTSAGIRDFLAGGATLAGERRSPCDTLLELSLYSDESAAVNIESQDLLHIFKHAHCFLSGRLRYLDFGGLTAEPRFLVAMPRQPALLDLGVANLWDTWDVIGLRLILSVQCPSLQVLDMTNTCMRHTRGATVNVMDLHQMLLAKNQSLRVVGLDGATLKSIAGGAGEWKVIRGKGRRAWYVKTTAEGPEMEACLKQLVKDERLTPANLGWHPRKMESARLSFA